MIEDIFPSMIRMEASQCAPALHKEPGESCLSKAAQTQINKAYRKTKRRSRVGGGPKNEFKWVKKAPLDPSEKKKLLHFFRPAMPAAWKKNPREWLDSFNIEDVLNQYEDAHSDFEFIGPVPIDFAKDLGGQCVVNELCKLNLANAYAKGTRKIGIVFNLDEHDQPGSHWMCAYIDVPGGDHKGAMYYFDSYGMRPPTRIANFMKECGRQGCTTLLYNDIRFQRKESECGTYCLYCILCLLKGKSFVEVCENAIDDDTMIKFRKMLFASESSTNVIKNVCV